MAASEVEICNLALGRIGWTDLLEDTGATLEELANSLRNPSSEQSRLHYARARDFTLGRWWWPFAKVREALAVVAGETRPDWAYVYAYPANAVKVRYVTLPGVRTPRPDQIPPTRIEARRDASGTVTGRLILCDQVDAEICYTARVANVAAFPQDFEDALVANLAARLAMPLVKGVEGGRLMRECLQEFEVLWRTAAAAAANEEKDDPEPDGEILASRR